MYFKDNIIHAKFVQLRAMIAVSRKFILLDLGIYDPLALIGLSIIIIAWRFVTGC